MEWESKRESERKRRRGRGWKDRDWKKEDTRTGGFIVTPGRQTKCRQSKRHQRKLECCEKMLQGETPETLMRNTKDIRHMLTEPERQRQPEADTWDDASQYENKQLTWKAWKVSVNGETGECEKAVPQCQAWDLLFEKGYHPAKRTLLSVISLDQRPWTIGHNTENSVYAYACATYSTGLSPYPRQDLHTPCTAPGCSMGHLLRTGRRKHNVLTLNKMKEQGKKREHKR